jgi:ribosome-binding ATPase YchF (GTP1/OBG family)
MWCLTGSGDPADDREVLMTELILADMQTVEKQAAPKGTITPALKKRWSVIEQIKTSFGCRQPGGQCAFG